MLQLFLSMEGVKAVHYGTSATAIKGSDGSVNGSEKSGTSSGSQMELEQLGVRFHYVPMNDEKRTKQWLDKVTGDTAANDSSVRDDDHGVVAAAANVLVVMDKFFAEEAYAFHIQKHLPNNAAIVLDMQDMHSLRWHREQIIKQREQQQQNQKTTDITFENDAPGDPLSQLPIRDFPTANDTDLQRELASIHRSDLTLVCSPAEMDLLHKTYNVPKEKLCLASFFVHESLIHRENPSFAERKDFVFLGGFRHAPNVDAVRQLKRLWPRIRTKVMQPQQHESGPPQHKDDLKLHVYGPFASKSLRDECHNPSEGFLFHGFSNKSTEEIVSRHRVMLAPLRFGAGIKGKIVDAWAYGTAIVTTPIGSEGMEGTSMVSSGASMDNNSNGGDWGGVIAKDSEDFVQHAASLYCNETRWQTATWQGKELLTELYGMQNFEKVRLELVDVVNNLESRRKSDYVRGILWHESLRSHGYFSRWIEAKNKP